MIAELTHAGTVVASSLRFGIDPQAAREKMRAFQLVDPYRYVLELVQAAHLLGAARINAWVDLDRFTLKFDGDPLTARDFVDLYAAALRDAHDPRARALKHLAIGLGAAEGLSPRSVEIESGGAFTGVRVRIVPGKDDLVDDTFVPERPGTRVVVRTGRVSRAALQKAQRLATGDFPEREFLRTQCMYSDRHITLDGTPVSFGRTLGNDHSWFDHVDVFDEPGTGLRGILGLKLSHGPSTVTLLQHGVRVLDHRLAHRPYIVRAIVEVDVLRKNISQSDFVRDAAWERLIDTTLLDAEHRALAQVMDTLTGAANARLARAVIGHMAERVSGFQALGADSRALLRRVEAMPLWPAADLVDGHEGFDIPRVSTAALGVGIDAKGALRTSRVRLRHVRLDDDHVMLARRRTDADLLARYTRRPVIDATGALERAYERVLNEQRWARQGIHRGLDDHTYPVRVRVDAPSIRGEVVLAISSGPRAYGELMLVHRGRLLRVHELRGSVLARLGIWVSGVLPVNDVFDDAMRDDAILEVALDTLSALPDLMDLLAGEDGRFVADRMGLLRTYLDGLVRDALVRAWCEAFGVGSGARQGADVDAWRDAHIRAEAGTHWAIAAPGAPAHPRVALGAMAPLAWLRTIHDLPMTFEQVAASLDAYGSVATAPADKDFEIRRAVRVGAALDLDRAIVWVDPGTARILRAIFGPGSLTDFTQQILTLAGRSAFMRRRERELVLDGAYAATVDLGGTRSGKVGLRMGRAMHDGKAWPDGGTLRVEVLVARRTLCVRELALPFADVDVLVEDEHLTPTVDWDGVIEDDAWRELERAARASVADAVLSFVQRVRSAPSILERPEVLGAAWALVIASSVRAQTLTAGLHDPVRASLARLPCIPFADGQWLSLEVARSRLSGADDVRFIDAARLDELDADAAERATIVALPGASRAWEELLRQLFPDAYRVLDVRSARDLDRRRRAAQRAFEASPEVALALDGDHLAVRHVVDPIAQGILGMRVDPEPLRHQGMMRAVLLHQRRRVRTIEIPVDFGVFDAIIDVDDLLDFSHDGRVVPEVREQVARLLARQAELLLLEALDLATTADSGEAGAVLRRMFWGYARRADDGDASGSRRVRAALLAVGIFPMVSGAWTSWSMVAMRREIPYAYAEQDPGTLEDDALVFSSVEDARWARRLFEPRRLVNAGPRRTGAYPALTGMFRAIDVSAFAQSIPLVRSAEELVDGVVHVLRQVRGEHVVLLHDRFLEAIVMREAVATSTRCASVVEGGEALIFPEHAVTKYAREHPGDVVALAFLASVVYSAINDDEEAITDEHERTFLELFARALDTLQ